VLIVELDGEAQAVEAEFQHLRRLIDQTGAYEVRVPATEAERQMIWKGRKSAFSAVGRISPDYIVQDGVVPRSKLGQALAEIDALSAKHNVRVANVFHAGDGNLHPLILYDGRQPGAYDRAEALAAEIMQLCIRLGGSITGEHGVGMEKRAYMPALFSPVDLDVMWQLRCVVDDLQIANRGKVFPGGEAPALSHAGPHPLERAGIISRE
jgi:glycolate oxidase